MDALKSWVYIDNTTNNIWKFSVNSDNELKYSIMYKEGKWTNEKLIDQNVLEYYIYADKVGIHIIYSNNKTELKYCALIEQQWMGKTLYKLDNKKVEIRNLNVLISDNEMHILYLLMDLDSNGHGIIMHCKWNGKETKVNKLQDVILASNLKEHYLACLDERNNIEMLYFSDEGNEISLYQCSYKSKRWTQATRLYGISGEDIEIKMLKDQYGIHVLNKFKENLAYCLVHVFINKNGTVYKLYVHESMSVLIEPIMFKKYNKLYIYWIEDNKIYSSFFKGKEWSIPICFIEDIELQVEKYYYIEFDDKDISKVREVYGIGDTDLNLVVPSETLNDKEQLALVQTKKILVNEELLQIDYDVKKLKTELNNLKSQNKVMEQTIASLNTQLQKKQKIQDEYENQISKIVNYKQKTEENYDIFMEVQKKLQNEIEEIKRLYEEEKITRENYEIKLKESDEEKMNFKEQMDKLIEENNKLSKDNKPGIRFWKH